VRPNEILLCISGFSFWNWFVSRKWSVHSVLLGLASTFVSNVLNRAFVPYEATNLHPAVNDLNIIQTENYISIRSNLPIRIGWAKTQLSNRTIFIIIIIIIIQLSENFVIIERKMPRIPKRQAWINNQVNKFASQSISKLSVFWYTAFGKTRHYGDLN